MGAAESGDDTLYYWDYLHLDRLLAAQTPKSVQAGAPEHDEYLFICVHQTSELWFKQILVELDSVLDTMGADRVPERAMGTVVARLQRISEIQRLLVSQIDVLETMTPLDFLDFRTFLVPASGFQSVQFRLIENKLGLEAADRMKVEGVCYAATLRPEHAQLVDRSEQAPSLFEHVERWLARNPFLRTDDFDFVSEFRQAACRLHAVERTALEADPRLDEDTRRKRLKTFESGVRKFDAVFDREAWEEDVAQGRRRLGYEAFMSALFINLYRDEPIFQLPFRVLTALIDIDEVLTTWRQRHALMAHRMLGRQSGTAGSGYAYLDETAKRHKIFKDLFDVSTYLLPRSALPPLPAGLARRLDFAAGD
jgi:tryptophan 2,3-dioxygenase